MNDTTPSDPMKAKDPLEASSEGNPHTHVAPTMRARGGFPKLLIGLVAFVLIVASLLAWLWLSRQNSPASGVYASVYDQVETTSDFNELKAAHISFAQQGDPNKKVDAKAIEKTLADEVILRLALQDEAKKQGKLNCTQAKVDELLEERYRAAGGRDEFYASLLDLYGWTPQVTAHTECLRYYRASLQDSLIGGYELSGTYVRWDIANGKDATAKAEIEQKAQDKLKNTFLPLYEKGATDEEIEAKTDINSKTTKAEFDAKVLSTSDPASRTIRLPRFNDEIYASFQQYEEGEKETKYVNKLSQGGHTKIFKSKTGYYIIYRATKKFNGRYTSYDAMLDSAKKVAKIDASYRGLPEAKPVKTDPSTNAGGLSLITSFVPKLLRAITPRAAAAVDCFGSIHQLPFTISYRDKLTGQEIPDNGSAGDIDGTVNILSYLNLVTACNDEPSAGTYGNVTVSYITGGKLNLSTTRHPNPWDFYLSCYSYAWYFQFGAPTGYNALSAADYNDVGNQRFLLAYQNSPLGWQVSDPASDTYFSIPDGYYSDVANGSTGYTIYVYFTKSVEFKGKMTTTKKLGTATPSTGLVAAAPVKITNSIPNSTWSFTSTNNPFTYSGLYVCETNKYNFNCGAAKYKNTVKVPSGYKVTSVNVTYPTAPPAAYFTIPAWPNAPAPSSFSCTGDNGTGDCSVGNTSSSGLWVRGHWNYCPSTGCTQANYVQSNWVEDPTAVVWNFEAIPTTDTYKYPWLQTTQGNVVANGKITGQVSSSGTDYPGARLTTSTAKEAEFLIISKVGGGGPFCSNKNYILTNDSATNINDPCGNGSGYSVLNVDSVAASPAGTDDKVVAGVKAAYNALGAACKTIADTASLSTLSGLLDKSATDCPNGVIIKFNSNVTLPTGFTTAQGRITLLVDGNLIIPDNINYGATVYANPKNVPNLAIVVKGNIDVSQSVTKVDASMYATGTISTCQVPTTYICAASSSQLVVNGFMSAQQGFRFGRVFTNGSRSAAEVINLTLQSVVYPPPGIDYNSVFKGDSSVKIDSSEYPPRF